MGTKLPKIAQRVFASTPGLNQISKFGSLAAGSPAYTTDAKEAMSLAAWLTGWFDAVVGGNSPAIEDFNAVPFVLSRQIAYLQQMGVPEWDAETEYFTGSMVNVAGVIYTCKADNVVNVSPTADPTKWKKNRPGEETGVGKDFWGTTLPDGYVWANGATIGNASSLASQRANNDTYDLFVMMWSSYDDATMPIYTSAGVLSTRGATADADWAANKRISVPDKRGRVSAGADNIGAVGAANRLTSLTISGGALIGKFGGGQTHTLSLSEIPYHDHSFSDPGHAHSIGIETSPGGTASGSGAIWNNGSRSTSTNGTNITFAGQGGGAAHNNVQPTIVCNYIIKL